MWDDEVGCGCVCGVCVWRVWVCDVCPAMRFVMLEGMGLNRGMGIGDWTPRLKSIFRSNLTKYQ